MDSEGLTVAWVPACYLIFAFKIIFRKLEILYCSKIVRAKITARLEDGDFDSTEACLMTLLVPPIYETWHLKEVFGFLILNSL